MSSGTVAESAPALHSRRHAVPTSDLLVPRHQLRTCPSLRDLPLRGQLFSLVDGVSVHN